MWAEAWAKSQEETPDSPAMWLSLATHLDDTAHVITLLWDHWVGTAFQRLLKQELADEARTVVIAAGALHDLGKLTRAFSAQVPSMRSHMETAGFTYRQFTDSSDARDLPHSLAGHVLVHDWLKQLGVPDRNATAFALVIGSHHGVPPSRAAINAGKQKRSLLGSGEWDVARQGLTTWLVGNHGLEHLPEILKDVRLSDAAQTALTGLVIAADWIASNTKLFPLSRCFDSGKSSDPARAQRAWASLALPPLWQPDSACLLQDVNELFHSRFSINHPARPIQELALASARQMSSPGMLLIEASMGTGKTEASLLAAEAMAAQWGAAGVFYGLPTRATTDAMFHRVHQWWEQVPGIQPDGNVNEPTTRSIQLRHSSAMLNSEFQALPRRANAAPAPTLPPPSDVGRDEIAATDKAATAKGRRAVELEVIAHQWTTHKLAAVADVVVATIDHQLMVALRTRHLQLRHLGVLRQVVVLDEIHAADIWMSQYLERSLEWLGRFGVPVIALSATLPPKQREALLHSYEKGRRASLAQSDSAPADTALPQVPTTHEYPLVTSLCDGVVQQTSAPAGKDIAVDLQWASDPAQLVERVRTAAQAGGCVLIVCNTVKHAREQYELFKKALGSQVMLTHSRFIGVDRSRNDTALLSRFGPPQLCEPQDRKGWVVVSTQVAEQSLDIDFDLLISDLAPVDVLLQRIGRLHRHERSRPETLRQPVCLVTGTTINVRPLVDAGSVKVYGKHLLLRTAALVQERVNNAQPVKVPSDVPILVDRCYSEEPIGDPAWAEDFAEAKTERDTVEAKSLHNAGVFVLPAPSPTATVEKWLERNVEQSADGTNGAKQVREPDGGFEMVLLQRAEDGLTFLPHLEDPRIIPTDVPLTSDLSRALAGCLVRVPGWVTNSSADVEKIFNDLNKNYFPPWQKDSFMGGQVILILDAAGHGRLGPFTVSYDPILGLEVQRG